MLAESRKAGVPYSTYKRKMLSEGKWLPNQGGKGNKTGHVFPIEEYLSGERFVHRHVLKLRLITEGLKPGHCEKCGLSEWLGEKIPLELDHIDRNGNNNTLSNLQILCPTCHAIKTRKDRKTKKVKTC